MSGFSWDGFGFDSVFSDGLFVSMPVFADGVRSRCNCLAKSTGTVGNGILPPTIFE